MTTSKTNWLRIAALVYVWAVRVVIGAALSAVISLFVYAVYLVDREVFIAIGTIVGIVGSIAVTLGLYQDAVKYLKRQSHPSQSQSTPPKNASSPANR